MWVVRSSLSGSRICRLVQAWEAIRSADGPREAEASLMEYATGVSEEAIAAVVNLSIRLTPRRRLTKAAYTYGG
jgi:hypothetical protein